MADLYTLGTSRRRNDFEIIHHYSRESALRIIDVLVVQHPFSSDLYELLISQFTIEERRELITSLAETSDNSGIVMEKLLSEIDDSNRLKYITDNLVTADPPLLSVGDVETAAREIYYKHYSGKQVGDPVYDRAGQLCRQFNFSEIDRKILSLLVTMNIHYPLLRISDQCDSIRDFFKFLSKILSVPYERISARLRNSSPLIISNTVEIDFLPPPFFSINNNIFGYFENPESTLPPAKFLRKADDSVYDLNTFTVPRESSDLCRKILTSGSSCSLLLYGTPGTGKTEYARSIARATGYPAYFLSSCHHSEEDSDKSRQFGLICSLKFIESNRAILIIDEADSLINSEASGRNEAEKGWMVDFLDNLKIKTIWISNNIDQVHPAVLRRFTSSISFSRFNKKDRISLWRKRICGTPLAHLISNESIDELSEKFDVNAGGIAKVINSVSSMPGIDGVAENRIIDIMRIMLEQHQSLLGHKINRSLKPLSSTYDPSILNTDTSLAYIENAIGKYDKSYHRQSLNILFWGSPGTGKTEYVKYLAQKCGKTLVLKRPSNLISKYVGETESLISDAFDEAEEKEAILFLDEADSFFISREKQERSFEKTQTNELLTQMENFSGILICSTNHLESLDHAVMRRFSWKVEFKPMKLSDRIKLYKIIFNRQDSPESLARGDFDLLTPGDMHAVKSRLQYSEERQSDETIIEELRKECFYKKDLRRKIGF